MYRKPFALLLFLLLGMTGIKAQNSYFVTTIEEPAAADSTGDGSLQDEVAMTAEEKFLNANFPTLSLCDWTPGMRFMVIPGNKDNYLRTFTDSITGSEIATGALKSKILTYRGHETSPRGWEHIHFFCEELQKAYYVELRNIAFEDYCQKTENGGIRALAYLGDVDKARELLLGKDMFTRGDCFYQDDRNATDGFREVNLKEDSHVVIEQIGVGTRDFPVKLVVRADDGHLYFQCVAMSRINCTLVSDDFYRENARHLFSKSFSFTSMSNKNSVAMSSRLLGQRVNSRQTVRLQKQDGTTVSMKANTIFLVKNVQNEPGTDYYKITLGNEGKDYTARITFTNKDVSGNVDGKQENYFDELFSVGTEFKSNNSTLKNETAITSQGGYAGMVSGIINVGMTKEQVRLSKGEPDEKKTNKDGTTVWKYFDASYVFSKAGKVIKITY